MFEPFYSFQNKKIIFLFWMTFISSSLDIVICEIQSLVLADINGAQGSYLWNVGSTENYIVADTAGLYTVQLTNVCGTTMDTIELIGEGCNSWFIFQTRSHPTWTSTTDCLG